MDKKDVSVIEFCKELNRYDFVIFDNSELKLPEVSELVELFAHKIPCVEFDLGKYHFCVNVNSYKNFIEYYKCATEKTGLYYKCGTVDSSLVELVMNVNSDKIHGKCFDLNNNNVIQRLCGYMGTNLVRNQKEKDLIDNKWMELKHLLNL